MGKIKKELPKIHRFGKGNKFGKGAPPVAIKLKAREFILECIGGEKGVQLIIAKVFQKAKAGSIKHQELLLNYILGRPVENIKIDAAYGQSMLSSPSVVKIIADNIRLDKLATDADAARSNMTPERIKEMEDILNKEINGKE